MAAAYKNSPKWVKRMEEFFVQSDLNKDGYLSIQDFDMWSDNLEREVKAEPALLKKARNATRDFWESTGLKQGVLLSKEQFVEKVAEVAVAEKTNFDEGKESLFFAMMETVFDAVDTNRDGFLQMSEYATMNKAGNFDDGTAKILFDIIDKNHDGKLSRKELLEYNIKFWFAPDDPEAAGLYGAKFEQN
ncbi:clytin-like [Halichondria panicea]|uniref:clytin-like n=1 Tax=Halichondria panicea TaxID=6063 RepID=UPI00312BCB52